MPLRRFDRLPQSVDDDWTTTESAPLRGRTPRSAPEQATDQIAAAL